MKKNVAIIVQKLHGGGAERTASNLSVILHKCYNIHLIVFDGADIKYPYEGVLHDLKLPPAKGVIGKLRNMARRCKLTKKIKKEENIAASISLMEGANLVNVLSKRKERVISSVRIQMSESRANTWVQKKWNLLQMRLIASKSDYIVALSKGVEKDLVENFSVPLKKAVTIYNPCDGNMLKQKAEVHFKDAETLSENSVITMGRLTEQKGQWHLIRAFSEIVRTVPDAVLYILGEGPLEEQLRELVSDLELDTKIVFLGFVEAPHAYIMRSKVFVFPSLFEGLGNVILEALACGTPVISSDCFSGPREILAPGTQVRGELNGCEYAQFGILTSVCGNAQFNASDPLTPEEKQIVDSVEHILTDAKLRNRYHDAALKRVQDFSPERIMREWISVIEG